MELIVGQKLKLKDNLRKLQQKWSFWESSYIVNETYIDGKDARGNDIISKFTCEEKRDYKDRKERTAPRNLIGNIVNTYSGAVFRNQVERDEALIDFYDNVDGRGKSLEETLRSSLIDTMIYGFSPVLIENLIPNTKLSIAQAKEIGVAQRIVNVDPFSLADWQELDGYLIYVVISFVDETGKSFYRKYTAATVQDIFVNDNMVITSLGEEVPHGYSDIPVKFMRIPISYESFVQPLAENQKSITNLLSLLFTELYEQCFTRWVLGGVDLSGLDEEQRREMQLEWGTRRMLMFPSSINVNKLGSDVTQADSIRKSIMEETESLLKTAGMQNQAVSSDSSGEARKLAKDDFYVIASLMVKAVEYTENYLLRLIGETMGLSMAPSSYSLNLEEPDWQSEITQLRDILSLEVSDEIKQKAINSFENRFFIE